MMISDKAGEYLVDIAKQTIEHYIKTKEKLEIPEDYPIERVGRARHHYLYCQALATYSEGLAASRWQQGQTDL